MNDNVCITTLTAMDMIRALAKREDVPIVYKDLEMVVHFSNRGRMNIPYQDTLGSLVRKSAVVLVCDLIRSKLNG